MLNNAIKPDQTSSSGRRDKGPSINYANELAAEYSTTSPDGSSNSTFLEPPANQISTQDGVHVAVKDELSSASTGEAQEFVTAETGETEDGKTTADGDIPSKEVSYRLDRSTRSTPKLSEKDLNSEAFDRRQKDEGNANRHSASYTNLSRSHSNLVSSSSTISQILGRTEGDCSETRRTSSPTSIAGKSSSSASSSSADSCSAIEPASSSINVQTEDQLFLNPSPSITSSSSSLSSPPSYRTSGEILSSQKIISSQSPSSSTSSSATAVNAISPQLLAQPAVGLPRQFIGHAPGTQLEVDQALLQRPGNVVFLVLQNRQNSKQLIQLAGFTSLEELRSDRATFPGYLIVDQLQAGQFEQPLDSPLEGSLDLTVRKQQPLTPEGVNQRSNSDVSTLVSTSRYDSNRAEGGVENLSSRDSGRQRNSTSLEPTALKHQNTMMSGSHLAPLANVSMASGAYFTQSSISSLPSPLPQPPSSSVMPAYALFVPPSKLPHQGHLVLSTPPSLPSPAPPQTPSASLQSPSATPNTSSLATSAKQFTCNICGKMYNNEKYLSMHVSIHNPSAGGLQQKLPSLVEKKCSIQSDVESYVDVNPSKKSFNVLNPSVSHSHEISLKIPARHFIAGTETISNAADLLDSQRNFVKGKPNVKVMAGGGQWKCKLCDKFFAQNSNYKNHMRTHSNERPYLCEICSIGFKERYHLKKHVLFKHSDEAKEQCRVCGKRFKDSTAVRAHERTHSNDRPYSCPRCHKSFKTSECLWHHENRSKTCGKTAAANAAKVEVPAPPENSQLTSPSPCKQPRRKKLDVLVNPSDIIEEIPSIPLTTGTDDYVEHYAQSHQMHHAQQLSIGDNLTTGEMQQEQLYYIHHHQHQMVYRQISQTPLSSVNFHQGDQKTFQQKHLLQLQESVETKPHVGVAVASQPISYLKVNGKSPVVVYTQSPGTNMNTPSWNASGSFSGIKNGEGFNQRSDIQDHYIYERQDSSNSLSGIKFEDPFQLNESYSNNVDGSLDTSVGSTGEKLFVIDRSSKQRFGDEEGKIIFSHGELHVAHVVECLEEVGEIPAVDGSENFEDRGKAEITGFNVSYEYPQQMMNDKSPIEIQNASTSLQNNDFYPSSSSFSYNSYQQRTNQSELVQQMSNSESERPFKCDICQSGFKLKVHLKKHQLYKHSDDYPCECKFCGKRFKDSSAVKLHERTHSEERPFSCECGKSFKTRENLWGHKHRGPCDYNNSNKDLKTSMTCLLAGGSKAYNTNSNIAANPGLNLTQTTFADNKLEPGLNFSRQTGKEVQKLCHLEAFSAVEQHKLNEDKSPKDSQAVYYDKCLVAAIQQQQLQPLNQAESSVNVNQTRKRSSLPTFDSKSQPGSAELLNSGESRASSKSTSNILVNATNLPTAVVVPIKRKKAEMTQVDVQTYNVQPSISTSANAPGVSNVPLGSPTSRTANSTLIPMMTSPQNVYMSSSNPHFGNGMRILNGHNITYQTAVDRSSAAQLNRSTKGGVVLPNHVEVLLDTKPSLPPFESLLFQAEQSRYQHQATQMNSTAFNGLVQNLCATNDIGVATPNSQLVYTANPRVVLTAPRSVQK